MESIIKRGGVIGTNSFREYVNSYLYIKSDYLMAKHGKELKSRPEDEGIVGMCYIDLEEGVCFDVFCTAYMSRGQLMCGDTYTDSLIIHISELEEMQYIVLAGLPGKKSLIKKNDEVMQKINSPEQKAVQEARKIKELDKARHLVHPDNVYIHLYKEDLELEMLWVKCLRMEGGTIICKLLEEPLQAFGVHEGDEARMNYVSLGEFNPPFWACVIR